MQRAWILVALLTAPIGRAAALPARLAPAARAARATLGTPTAEPVEIRTEDGLLLKGTARAPKAGGGPAPGALLIHDSGGDSAQLADIAERLVKGGFFVLSVDLRGHGASKTADLDWEKLDAEGRKSLWAFAPRDVEAAASWMRGQGGVHRTNLNLVGYGSGCSLAVRHAARDENVRNVALIDPKPQEFGFDVASEILEIEGTPTYVVATKRTRSETEQMVKTANADFEYVTIDFASPKSDTALDDKRVAASLVRWLKEQAFPQRGR